MYRTFDIPVRYLQGILSIRHMSPGESNKEEILSMDEIFLNKIREYVIRNISSEEFSLEALVLELGYSRSQVHKKLKKITGKSLSAFVREIRLEEALRLLKADAGTAAEIAYRTGFSSPAYFSKCFTDYYGITPGEVNKNGSQNKKPLNITRKIKPAFKTSKWRLSVSGISIGLLAIAAVILAYPRIFSREESMSKMTVPVTFLNESGEKETRLVFKEKYIPRLMIFKFISEDEDAIDEWLAYGIPVGIKIELDQFQYLQVNANPEAGPLQEQIEISGINNCHYFLTGTCRFIEGNYLINTKLYKTHPGRLERDTIYTGNDLFTLLDTISLHIRRDLGISEEVINSFKDLPFYEYTTSNIEAYKHFINGYNTPGVYYEYIHYLRALEVDSTFSLAAYQYAKTLHHYSHGRISALKYANLADRHKDELYEYKKIQVRSLKYQIEGNIPRAIYYLEMLQKSRPSDSNILLEISNLYEQQLMYAEVEKTFARLNKLVPGNTDYQRMRLESLIKSGRLNKGLRLTRSLLKENPENAIFHFYEGIIYLHKGNLDKSENSLRTAIEFSTENEEAWSKLFDHIDFLRKNPESVNLDKFTGQYRSDFSEMITPVFIHNNHLIIIYGSQGGGEFMYPVSDTSFIRVGYDGSLSHITFNLNKSGDVYMATHLEGKKPGSLIYVWKYDSLITSAIELFESDKPGEALVAFKKAYSENPEHYYLDYYIRHLEYIQSQEYIEDQSLLESYTGSYYTYTGSYYYLSYQDTTFYPNLSNPVKSGELIKEGDHFYVKLNSDLTWRVLPMSQNEFMNTSCYLHTYSCRLDDNENIIMSLKNKRGSMFLKSVSE